MGGREGSTDHISSFQQFIPNMLSGPSGDEAHAKTIGCMLIMFHKILNIFIFGSQIHHYHIRLECKFPNTKVNKYDKVAEGSA